jgi:glycosyltransferase involved in cell wall biosynthesis
LNATRGISAEVLRVPSSSERSERLADEIFINRALQLPTVDRVIALMFPAYIIPHHTKVIWLLHRLWQAHEPTDRAGPNLPEPSTEEKIRQWIWRCDFEAFSESRRIFTGSQVIRECLRRDNGFESDVLIPPLNNPELFGNCGDGGYVFAGGRVNLDMRQHLLVESMALTKSAAKLIVGGPPDTPNDADRLRSSVKRLKLEERVILDFGFHSEAKIADYVNHAHACACLNMDEHSVGRVTMEAASACKPVITLSDSGKMLAPVLDGETGCVAEPNAQAIAGAIDSLYSDHTRCEQMGYAMRSLWESLGVTWLQTIEKLLS